MKLPPSNQHSRVPLAYFKIAKIGNQPKYHLSDEWMRYVVQTLGGILFRLKKVANPAIGCKVHKPGELGTIWNNLEKQNVLSALTSVGNIVTVNKFLCNIHRENEAVLTEGRRKWGGARGRIRCSRWAGWRSLKIDWIVVHRQHYILRNLLKALHRCSCQCWWAILGDEGYFSLEYHLSHVCVSPKTIPCILK